MELRQDDPKRGVKVLTHGTHLGFHFTICSVADKWYTAYIAIPQNNDCALMPDNKVNERLMIQGGLTYNENERINGKPYTIIGWDYGHALQLCDLPKSKSHWCDIGGEKEANVYRYTINRVLSDIIAVIDRLKKYTLES